MNTNIYPANANPFNGIIGDPVTGNAPVSLTSFTYPTIPAEERETEARKAIITFLSSLPEEKASAYSERIRKIMKIQDILRDLIREYPAFDMEYQILVASSFRLLDKQVNCLKAIAIANRD